MNQPSASHSPLLPVDNRLDKIRIVLSHTSHPGNIGAAARAMKTMGLARLTLVNPKCFSRMQRRLLAPLVQTIYLNAPRVCSTLDEALADSVFALAISARQRNLGPQPMAARSAAPGVLALAAGGDEVALVFGNETAGLVQCRSTALSANGFSSRPILNIPRSTWGRRCSCCAMNCVWRRLTGSRRS